MRTLTCTKCPKTFESLDQDLALKDVIGGSDEPICFSCALKWITGGRPPEEGDFNSARIISGEMTEQEWRWLQEDLRSVEEGRSIRECESWEDDDYVDPAWCYACNRDIAFCECDEDPLDDAAYWDGFSEEDPEPVSPERRNPPLDDDEDAWEVFWDEAERERIEMDKKDYLEIVRTFKIFNRTWWAIALDYLKLLFRRP